MKSAVLRAMGALTALLAFTACGGESGVSPAPVGSATGASGSDATPSSNTSGGLTANAESNPVSSLGDIMRTPGLIAKLEKLATRACDCSDLKCFSATRAELDKVIGGHSNVKLSKADANRARAAAERLIGCEDKLAKPSASPATVEPPTAPPAGTPEEQALARLLAAVDARCECPDDDAACATRTDAELTAALARCETMTFATPMEAARRSLVFEAEECRGPQPVSRASKGGRATGGKGDGYGGGPEGLARGKVQRWSDLPRTVNGLKHLMKMGTREGSEFIDAVWGQKPADVMARYPGAEKAEFNDLEPSTTRVRLKVGEVDNRGRNLVVEWRFLHGRLFMVVVELKRTARDLPKRVAAFMGRPADSRHEEDWKMKVLTWNDGDLAIRATIDGRANDFAVAHRQRLEEYMARRTRGQKALQANKRGLKRLFTRPYSPAYRTIEKHFLEAATLVPRYGHAHVNLCRLYVMWGHTEHAKARCAKARKSRNASAKAEAALYEGMLASVAGDYETGKTLLREVKTHEPEDTSLLTASNRLLRLIGGRGKKRDFKRMYREVACALVEKDRNRAKTYAKASGFATVKAFGEAARKAGIDIEKGDAWATKVCGRTLRLSAQAAE